MAPNSTQTRHPDSTQKGEADPADAGRQHPTAPKADGAAGAPAGSPAAGQAPGKPGKRARAKWTPPAGIRYAYRADRPSAPYYLHWQDGAIRHKRAFKDEAARELSARALAEKREREGISIFSFDPVEWRRYEEIRAVVAEVDAQMDPVTAIREWAQARRDARERQGERRGSDRTVEEAVAEYLRMRTQEGGITPEYLKHVRGHLEKSLVPVMGSLTLAEVEATALRAWLGNLRGKVRKGSTGELGYLARLHRYRTVHAFFNRCVAEGWVERNPCDIVATPKPSKEEMLAGERIRLMPVGDVEKLFAANAGYAVVGRLALEAFGGVRYATAGALRREHLNFEIRGITMPGALHKSKKRKFRQGHPETLWAWLEYVEEELPDCWKLTETEYYHEKTKAFVRAGVKNPHNGLRHSFCSYLLAATRDLPKVSYMMQHAKTSMTERYEGAATQEDAERYWAIRPAGRADGERGKEQGQGNAGGAG